MKAKAITPFLAFALLGATVVVGMAAYVKVAKADKVQPAERRQEAQRQEKPKPAARQERTPRTAMVASPVYEGGEVRYEHRRVEVPEGVDAKLHVVDQYLHQTKLVDQTTRLLSVDVKEGHADLYFNAGIRETTGSDDEALIINGIAKTLGQFTEIKDFSIYADGDLVDTLGHLDLSEPIPVQRD